ncbi:HEAT repeat domain-containing protein [Polycladomyces subterraneus]|uniref:HEAT repeat domain-containing protein n=1 Tax=Polycladomyces subterraneus TaxID=1016997 RepID=A0ABT8ISJ0_9BACL|nr:HEAT repeat domain-containing protein [Polycladomyces subterraneus]MDN4595004.1 HEAT repeat domain-containing protein [Polycladomyces subterraneus]
MNPGDKREKKRTLPNGCEVGQLGKRDTMWPAFQTMVEKGEAAVPTLMEGLQDVDEQVRGVAAVALGEIGSAAREAVPQLIALLYEENRETRMAAALALMKIGPDAVEALQTCLQSDNRQARFWAAWALTMNDPSQTEAVNVLREAWADDRNDKYVHLAAAEAIFKAMRYQSSKR